MNEIMRLNKELELSKIKFDHFEKDNEWLKNEVARLKRMIEFNKEEFN